MRPLSRQRVESLVNGLLLTAVIIFLIAPFLGINPSAYSATHQHLYFGEVDIDHDHHTHTHPANDDSRNVDALNAFELIQYVSNGIAFLPSLDVSGLGLVYIALVWLTAVFSYTSPKKQPKRWQDHAFGINLIYILLDKKPPR